MRIPGINLLGAFKGVLGGFKHVRNLPKLIGYCQEAAKYLKLVHLIKDGLKVPAANFLFQVKKSISDLQDQAAKTDLNKDGDFTNDPDDKLWRVAHSAVDAVLEFFRLADDCQKLIDLDNAADPQK